MADTIIWNGPGHVDYYAITFDDGSYRLPIERWLDALEAEGAAGKDSGDWAGISSEQIAQNLIPGLKNGYIAVLHSNDIAVGSPGAIKLIADAARHAGLIPVTVPVLLESLGIKPAFRSWKLVVEVPERVDYPPEDWKPAEESDEVRRLAGQVSSWGIDRHRL